MAQTVKITPASGLLEFIGNTTSNKPYLQHDDNGNLTLTLQATKKFTVAGNLKVNGKVTMAQQTLTDGAAITWDFNSGANAKVTLAGARTLVISNMEAGDTGLILVKQDAAGSRTLTLPGSSSIVGGGSYTASPAANATDVLGVYYDGTTYWWTIGYNTVTPPLTSVGITGGDFVIANSPLTANGNIGLALATVNSTVGTFGSATAVPVITVNAKGLVTAVSATNISIPTNLDSLTDVTITSAATNQLLQFNGSQWVNWSPNYLTQAVTLQDTPPAGVDGKLWWETDTGKLKVYYGAASAWVDALPMPDMTLYLSTAGGAISGDLSIAQTLTVTGNILTSGNLTVSGTISASGYNNSNWNSAYNDTITSAAVSGTTSKTLTLTQRDGGTVTATWTDIDTDTDAQTLSVSGSTLSISGGNSITLPASGISQATADGLYVNISGDEMTGNLYISPISANPAQIQLAGTNPELYVSAKTGTARVFINREGTGHQATLMFTTAMNVFQGTAWDYTGAPMWSMGMTNNNNTNSFKIAYGDIYEPTLVALEITTANTAYFKYVPYAAGNLLATQSWVTSQGYITGYTETDTLASVTGRGATTSTTLTLAKVITTGLYGPSTGGNVAIWQYDASNTGYGIVYNEGSPDTLRIDVSGQALTGTPDFLVGADYAQVNGNNVWHAGNLTNLNQLTNGPGYITTTGRAYPRRADGTNINFYWTGQSGQPSWLWGSNNGEDFYVWNPSNFSVAYASDAKWISFEDGPRDLSDRRPNWNNRSVAWDFVNAGTADGVGNYAGVMTFSPWDGTSGSTGDSSYQLAFINETGLNASGVPGLRLRNGIDSTWNNWYQVWHGGHFSQTNINNWNSAYGWGNHASAGYATTGYVTTQINNLIDAAPGTLDTLNELAAALGDDPNFATSFTTLIGNKVSKAGDTMTGVLTINTNAAGLILNRGAVSNYNGIYYSTANVPKWFIGMRENLGSNNHIHYSEELTRDILTLNVTNGNATVFGTITASNFSGSSSGTNTGDQTNISGNAATATALTSMNISQFTNNSGYITSYSETDTLYSVTNRGNTTIQDIEFTNGRKGLVGRYNAAQTQAVFSMGYPYVLDDGAGSSQIGNLYGLAWSYNPNYGGAGNNPQSIAGLNHQLLLMQAGVTTAAMGSGIWTSGNISAANFSGSSSGTNTGDQTNISGNAATATNAVAASNLSLTYLGTASVNVNNGSSAVYRNENGSGGNLSYAPVLHLGGGDTMWQIQGDYYDSSTLRWRAGYNGTWYAWRDIIHSGNIGSQSVLYAATAGALTSMNISQFTNNSGYLTSLPSHNHDDRYYTESESDLRFAAISHSHTFASLTSKPTTISGYGITDAITTGNIGSQSVNYATYAAYVENDEYYMRFHWSGQNGQPTWLWGGDAGENMYIYDPSNFSVNYANSAGALSSMNISQFTNNSGYLTSLPSHNHDDRYYTETESDSRYPLSRGALGTTTNIGDATGFGNNLASGTYTRSYVGHGGQVWVSHDTGGSVGNFALEVTYYGSMYVHTNVDSSSWVTKQIWTSDSFANNSSNWNTAYGWGNHASAGYLTSLPSHNHDDRYYTESESDARFAAASHSHAWTSITSKPAASNWNTNGNSIDVVVGMLSWKNYGDGHVIFDASRSTSPGGSAVSNTNPDNYWTGTYPTLMGWNGSNTYGVRVDVSRYSDSTGSVAWSNVSSRPTALSSFTNDLGNYGGWITGYTETIGTNNTSGVAGAKYQINDTWLRVNSDNRQFQIYANSQSIIYRTDGVTNDHGGGGYPHIFYYGGSTDAQRIVIFGTDGDIYVKYAGSWLSTLLAAKSNTGHTHDDRYYTETESDARFLIGTTSPSTPGNFTLSIGNNGSYSYVQSHSGQPLRLNPVGNAVFVDSTLTVSGDVTGSNLNISNWNTAYNKRPTAISFSGTGTKTLTLTQGDGSTLTASFSDIDTDTNTDAQTLTLNGSTLSISGGNSITLPSGGISQGTADSLYVNVSGDTMTGALRINGSTLGQELFAVDGTNGRLFTVTDDLSDSLYSVNTLAGLPVLEVFANNVVTIGKFGTNAIYVGQDGRVGFGTTDFSYTTSDTAGTTGTPNANRVFVNGSVQLIGSNDGFVVGRSGASFFKDEEIAFGWGGGWFMQDATYLRVRGNKMVYSGGSARFDGNIFVGNETYYFYGDAPNAGIRTNGSFLVNGDIYFGTRGEWLSTYLNQAVRTDSSPRFGQVYNAGWFRNDNTNTGLYNQTTTQHLSSQTNGYWDMSSTTSVSAIRFYTGGHVTSLRGHVYANSSNEIGFLNSAGNWGLRMDNNYNVQIYGTVSATNFSGSSSGTNTGDQTNISGNAATATALTSMNISQFTNNSGYIAAGSTVSEVAAQVNATRFRSAGDISQAAGNHALQIFADVNNDAFMAFHISNDYAVHFGLDDSTNRLYVGGWSDGTGTKYQMWDSRDFSSTNISNWNTAYGWGNHAGAGYQAASTAITTSNIGSQSVSNASTAGGLYVHNNRNNEANKIVRTDANGYIQAGWINTTSGAFSSAINKIYCSDDDYMRYQTPANFISNLGLITTSNIGSQSVNYAASAGAVAWTNVSGRPTALSQFTNDLSLGGAVVTIQDSAPAGTAGQLWWESDTGKLKVYYSSVWVDATPVPDMSLYYAKAGGSIDGDVTIRQTLTVVGNTLIQGVLTETSDISLKENILPLESSLDKLMKLNGVSFNKKTTPHVKEIGFIAQDVEEIIPDLVTETSDGIKTVAYSRVSAILVETIKEQQTQITELKEMVNILTKKINDL